MTISLTNALLRAYIEDAFHVEAPAGVLNLFGVRGARPASADSIEVIWNIKNRYLDTVGTFGTVLRLFPATVDPGATWTKHPSNPKGAAHLVPGHWRYQLGLHKGRPALVQAAPVTVRRDRDRDGRPEMDEPRDTGWFGINFHSGGDRPTIDAWSAGCQVIPRAHWTAFYTLCATSGQKQFDYFLLDGNLFAKWVETQG